MKASMLKEIDEEFRLIQHELFTIIAKWRTFTELYGIEPNVKLLNDTAPLFFWFVQDIFLDNVILSIVRLLDPPKSMGKENLTIAHLIEHIKKAGQITLHAEALDLYSSLRADGAQLIILRNKLLAHNDLAEKQTKSAALYSGVSRNFIEEFIQRLCTLMNKIHGSLSDTETIYETAGMNPQSAPALLRALRKARQAAKDEDGI